jgi:hypothetical protein
MAALLLVTACAPTSQYPIEGNVPKESYRHVSGVVDKRNASAETAYGIASAAAYATGEVIAGGTPQTLNRNEEIRAAAGGLPRVTPTPVTCRVIRESEPK